MGRKSKTQQLLETTVGEHLALSVAAHLARTQLIPKPLAVYDGQHILDMINVVGRALARVAQLFVLDVETGGRRELSQAEVEGVTVKQGATVLMLKDGRALSGVTIKRGDLRQAIAILKTAGMPELGAAIAITQQSAPKASPGDRIEELRSQLAELEGLLRLPLTPTAAQRATQIAISIARKAPHGQIANLAMQLMSAVGDALKGGDEQNLRIMLARLGTALRELSVS